MPHLSLRRHSNDLQVKKCQVNVKRIKVEHLSDEDGWSCSLDKSSSEVPYSQFEPLAKKPVKLEQVIPVHVKRIKVEHLSEDVQRSSLGLSSFEVPDSLFEPLTRSPVKLELNNKFTCKYCQKVLATSMGLTVHLGKIHKIFRTFNCEQCNLEHPSFAMLERHMVSSHHVQQDKQVQKDKILECPHCDKKFERQSNLANHIRIVHKEKITKHCCVGCGLEFTSASKLMVHAVFEQKIVKVSCELCKVKTEVKLNCALEKTLRDTGMKAKCKNCTEKNKA